MRMFKKFSWTILRRPKHTVYGYRLSVKYFQRCKIFEFGIKKDPQILEAIQEVETPRKEYSSGEPQNSTIQSDPPQDDLNTSLHDIEEHGEINDTHANDTFDDALPEDRV